MPARTSSHSHTHTHNASQIESCTGHDRDRDAEPTQQQQQKIFGLIRQFLIIIETPENFFLSPLPLLAVLHSFVLLAARYTPLLSIFRVGYLCESMRVCVGGWLGLRNKLDTFSSGGASDERRSMLKDCQLILYARYNTLSKVCVDCRRLIWYRVSWRSCCGARYPHRFASTHTHTHNNIHFHFTT